MEVVPSFHSPLNPLPSREGNYFRSPPPQRGERLGGGESRASFDTLLRSYSGCFPWCHGEGGSLEEGETIISPSP
jgi:hypothetical protein